MGIQLDEEFEELKADCYAALKCNTDQRQLWIAHAFRNIEVFCQLRPPYKVT